MNNDYNYDAYQYGNTQPETDENQKEYIDVNFVMRDAQPEENQEEYRYEYRQEPVRKKKKSGNVKKWITCISMAIAFGLVASVVFQASNRLINGFLGEPSSNKKEVNTTQITTNSDSVVNSDVARVAANVMPSVVSITNLSIQEVQSFFFGGYTEESESSGSGIIIGQNDSELLIVSNNHVVEGSKTLTVTFVDEESVEAQIKGTNPDMDLAIIVVPLSEISNETLDAIKIANLGDSDALVVGEPTIAIGNALGYGQSVTTGIVSALGRTIDDLEVELIQTDAAINPGNSGGALLNANGEVIGINTAKVNDSKVEGMGYAISISDVSDILNELMNKETRTKVEESKRGTLGISGVTVDSNVAQVYGMPEGVHVSEIIKGGGAYKAGLPKGCIITKFDGISIETMEELQGQLEYYKAGEKVEVTVKIASEDGEYVEKTFEVILGKQSDIR